MISYSAYKVIHLTGIFLLLLSLGGLFINHKKAPHKKWLMAFNGSGLLISLIGGFGLLARLGNMSPFPKWVWAKLSIWVILAILPSIAFRKNIAPAKLSFVVVVLGVMAIYLANYKPF